MNPTVVSGTPVEVTPILPTQVTNQEKSTVVHPLDGVQLAFLHGIMQVGGNSNSPGKSGDTWLHYAARQRDARLAQVLVAGKGDVNQANKEGDTPLHVAIAAKAYSVIEVLVRAGAEVRKKTEGRLSPLEQALANLDLEATVALFGNQQQAQDMMESVMRHLQVMNSQQQQQAAAKDL